MRARKLARFSRVYAAFQPGGLFDGYLIAMSRINEAAFETVIESHSLANGFVPVSKEGFDRDRAIFPETVAVYLNAFNDMNEANWANLKSSLESDPRLQLGAAG